MSEDRLTKIERDLEEIREIIAKDAPMIEAMRFLLGFALAGDIPPHDEIVRWAVASAREPALVAALVDEVERMLSRRSAKASAADL